VKHTAAASIAIAAALAAPAAASAQATLSVDPASRCYRELSDVTLTGNGFTPNGLVNFTRGTSIIKGSPIPADASGQVTATLSLPDLISGQQRLTYAATDATNATLTSQIALVVSATDVDVRPPHGAPNRRLTISARGFIGRGSTLWAHVLKKGAKAKTARNAAIGRLKGSCKTLKTKKRLFAAGAAPGVYRVQFDNYRRYNPSRVAKVVFSVTVFRTVQPATAASTGWVRVG
jgi:hypothetical protein